MVRSGFAERERLVAEHPDTFSVTPRLEAHKKVMVDLVPGREDAAFAAVTAAWELERRAR